MEAFYFVVFINVAEMDVYGGATGTGTGNLGNRRHVCARFYIDLCAGEQIPYTGGNKIPCTDGHKFHALVENCITIDFCLC